MTMAQILDQAKALSLHEHKELAKLLIDTLDASEPALLHKTGAEIVPMLEAMELIEIVDATMEDPVEWVRTQRRKRADQLKPYRKD